MTNDEVALVNRQSSIVNLLHRHQMAHFMDHTPKGRGVRLLHRLIQLGEAQTPNSVLLVELHTDRARAVGDAQFLALSRHPGLLVRRAARRGSPIQPTYRDAWLPLQE